LCLATAKHFCFPIIWVYSSIFLFPYGSTWPRARELDVWTHQQALSAQSYEEKKQRQLRERVVIGVLPRAACIMTSWWAASSAQEKQNDCGRERRCGPMARQEAGSGME